MGGLVRAPAQPGEPAFPHGPFYPAMHGLISSQDRQEGAEVLLITTPSSGSAQVQKLARKRSDPFCYLYHHRHTPLDMHDSTY